MQTQTSVKSILDETQKRMQKALDAMRSEFQSIRTGRASAALVENIQVDYYGTMTPMKGVANISTPDPKTVAIHPWDPSIVSAVEKAILKTDLGLTPSNDGKVIRIKMSALTEERRKELDRVIRKTSEDGRVSVRNVRHEANDAVKRLEKEKTISEDEMHINQKKVQELTDRFVALIDDALKKKEAEIQAI